MGAVSRPRMFSCFLKHRLFHLFRLEESTSQIRYRMPCHRACHDSCYNSYSESAMTICLDRIADRILNFDSVGWLEAQDFEVFGWTKCCSSPWYNLIARCCEGLPNPLVYSRGKWSYTHCLSFGYSFGHMGLGNLMT